MFKIPGPVLEAWFWSPQRLLQELENNYEILCCTHNTGGFGYYCMNWKTTARKTLCCTHNSEGFSDCDMNWRTSARNCIVWIILMVSATIACTGKQLRSCFVPILMKVSTTVTRAGEQLPDPLLYLWFRWFRWPWQKLENNYQMLYCPATSKRFCDWNWRTTTRPFIVPIMMMFQWPWHKVENDYQIMYCTHASEGFYVCDRNWRTTTRSFTVPIILMILMTMAQSGEWLPGDPVLYPYFWRFYCDRKWIRTVISCVIPTILKVSMTGTDWRTSSRTYIVPMILMISATMARAGEQLPDHVQGGHGSEACDSWQSKPRGEGVSGYHLVSWPLSAPHRQSASGPHIYQGWCPVRAVMELPLVGWRKCCWTQRCIKSNVWEW